MSLIDSPPVIKKESWESAVQFSIRTRQALQQLAHLRLGYDSAPAFENITIDGLTATRLVQSNASKKLTSVSDLTSWVAGTANEIDIADDGDGTITIGIVNPLIVGKGGTGTDALTDHSLLVGSGADAVTLLGVASNGQLPIGSAGADPVLAVLTGTAKQVLVANAAGSITLSTPQDIDTDSTPTFANLSLGTGELTCGSINRAADTLTLEIAGTPKVSIAAAVTTVASRLLVDQDADAIALDIDSAATTDTNYGLSVTTTAGAMVAEFLNGDGNAGMCYLGLLSNNAYSGTYFFSRNLTAALTDCPVVYMVQDHEDDDRPVLELKQDGSGEALLISEGGRMTITGGITISDALIIPDDGYIGSVSETSAIQISSTGVVTFIGAIDTPSDITCGGHLMFDVDRGSVGMLDSSPRITFDETGDQAEVTGNLIVSKHLAIAGTSIDADIGVIYGELLTDTDNSIKRGISSELQVTKTAAAMTAKAAGVYSSIILDSTNTQNWSDALAGLCAIHSHVETEAGSAGTITGAVNLLITGTFADAATVISYAGIYIETPTVANNKVTTAYGIYIDNIDTAGTNNYAIYTTAGAVRLGGAVTCLSTLEATGEITCPSINKATGTLTLEIGGTAEVSITATTVTLGGNLIIPDSGTIGSASDTDVMTIDSSGNTTFSVFPITPSAEPDADYEVANKKYVDDHAGVASTWIGLTDTDPANYTGEAGNCVVVNAGEDGLEFGAAPGGGAAAAGGGTVILFPWLYDSITQGTWTLLLNENYLYGAYSSNTTTNDGDRLNWKTYLGAGTYTLKLLGIRHTNAGVVDIYIDDVEVASFDQYNGSLVRNYVYTQTGIVVTAGVKEIRFIVDGKHASSSDYIGYIQSLVFYRTA